MLFGLEIELLSLILAAAAASGTGGVYVLRMFYNRHSLLTARKEINQHLDSLKNLLAEAKRQHSQLKPIAEETRNNYQALSKAEREKNAEAWQRGVKKLLAKCRAFEKEKRALALEMASESTRKVISFNKASRINRIIVDDFDMVKTFGNITLTSALIEYDWSGIEKALEEAKI
ncbi:hypothetical protein GN330_00095 [Nitratireductor sp. CAU 1489]|uniref:Uncharacterized protein n=1 Tax=Nitratireductor arenosus TaxID=2682096 RepID=A0A844QAI1_9HYPH|nr:hypothetical protein [Nitratireductor arenosus]MVA95654.1 hypothetical protein [Nitratireductor arenosus]